MLLALVPLMLMHYWVLVFGHCCAQLFTPSFPPQGFPVSILLPAGLQSMPVASSPHLSVNCQIADQLVPSAARAFRKNPPTSLS